MLNYIGLKIPHDKNIHQEKVKCSKMRHLHSVKNNKYFDHNDKIKTEKETIYKMSIRDVNESKNRKNDRL